MKKLIILFVMVVITLSLACMQDPGTCDPKNKHYIKVLGEQAEASDYRAGLIEFTYVKDERTHLCFAYLNSVHGPALAYVPCEHVENYLKVNELPIEGPP